MRRPQKSPKAVEVRVEQRVTHIAFIQETRVCVTRETKRQQYFPKLNQIVYVLKLHKSAASYSEWVWNSLQQESFAHGTQMLQGTLCTWMKHRMDVPECWYLTAWNENGFFLWEPQIPWQNFMRIHPVLRDFSGSKHCLQFYLFKLAKNNN